MIHARTDPGVIDPGRTIDALVARHGAWRVLLAAARAAVAGRPRPRRDDVDGLSDWLRRDVGLAPRGVDHRAGHQGARRQIDPYRLPHERRDEPFA